MIAEPTSTVGVDVLRENDLYIESLQTAVDRGEFSLDHMPSLVTKIVHENRWQRRWVRALQREVTFARFADFVGTKTPEGLGASVTMLKRMCSDDPTALAAIDEALENPKHLHINRGDDHNIHISTEVSSLSVAPGDC